PLAHMSEEIKQGLPETADVRDDHGLGVTLKLQPAQLFGELFQSSDAAGQRDKGVGALEHQPLALVHATDNEIVRETSQETLPAHQEVRNDACGVAAIG